MDIFGSGLSTLRHKELGQLEKKEQETLAQEFSSMMWHEVLKSLEKCDDVLSSEFSKGTHDQLTSLRYQMLSHKMGEQYPLDFSSVFKEPLEEQDFQPLDKTRQERRFTPLEQKVKTQENQTLENQLSYKENKINSSIEQKIPSPKNNEKLSFQSPEDFVQSLYPLIEEMNPNKKAIPPIAVLAQAALETGWGKKILGHEGEEPSFNLFNIKATPERWQGDKIVKNALEVLDGGVQKIKSSFRSYSSFQESIEDYFQFIQQGRYKQACEEPQSPESFISKISQAGYATDPLYEEKIHSLMNRLEKFLGHGGLL